MVPEKSQPSGAHEHPGPHPGTNLLWETIPGAATPNHTAVEWDAQTRPPH